MNKKQFRLELTYRKERDLGVVGVPFLSDSCGNECFHQDVDSISSSFRCLAYSVAISAKKWIFSARNWWQMFFACSAYTPQNLSYV